MGGVSSWLFFPNVNQLQIKLSCSRHWTASRPGWGREWGQGVVGRVPNRGRDLHHGNRKGLSRGVTVQLLSLSAHGRGRRRRESWLRPEFTWRGQSPCGERRDRLASCRGAQAATQASSLRSKSDMMAFLPHPKSPAAGRPRWPTTRILGLGGIHGHLLGTRSQVLH